MIEIGNATFRKNTCLNQIIKPSIMRMLKKHQKFWQINGMTYYEQNWKEIFKIMIESYIKHLRLNQHKNHLILKEISLIAFHNLKKLNLGLSNIRNIQCVQLVNAPQMEILLLYGNFITIIRSIRKTNFYQLKRLEVYNNQLTSITSLTETNFRNLEFLWVEKCFIDLLQMDHISDLSFSEDLAWSVKINPKDLKILRFNEDQRIPQGLVKRQMEQKYVNALIQEQ